MATIIVGRYPPSTSSKSTSLPIIGTSIVPIIETNMAWPRDCHSQRGGWHSPGPLKFLSNHPSSTYIVTVHVDGICFLAKPFRKTCFEPKFWEDLQVVFPLVCSVLANSTSMLLFYEGDLPGPL
jgi:hypothetical protein